MATKKSKKTKTPVIQRAVRAIRTGRVAVRAVGEFVRDEIDDLRAKRGSSAKSGSKKRKRGAGAGTATRRAATKTRRSRTSGRATKRATRSKGRSPTGGRKKKSSRAKPSAR